MRRDLHPVPLAEVWPPRPGNAILLITMGVGQWDATLLAAYEAGWVLLELDDDEQPVRAYRKAPSIKQ
jgi:hypothetical protein